MHLKHSDQLTLIGIILVVLILVIFEIVFTSVRNHYGSETALKPVIIPSFDYPSSLRGAHPSNPYAERTP